ncbi:MULTISPECIES: bifunctional 2-polyprenyl-6-hydroxyphenol methylase/3-demethylubiquinol 3-O-methyltransferase UbiG [Streptomyces]|uniref:Class I SAM-dependent methyltransferase n=1 Tax=Streptomyces lycii TaxID=2654337 RepID=A0ABQ7FRM8_9ACTN|nr:MULTISPECIES: class I SAM-dependent methyltransferase [Streptomyces]KAF4410616.1 class I SAM-dependent methyltransferase [Streptomyces lycii]
MDPNTGDGRAGARRWNPAGDGAPPSAEIAWLARSGGIASVLDAGCGWGRHLAVFAGTARTLHGFDPDEEGVAATRERLRGAAADTRAWAATLASAEPPAAPYDVVVCYGVLHFLPRTERADAYDRLASWTRPGGLLAIASFNAAVPIPPDLRPLMPEPPPDSGELRTRFADWETVRARSHVFDDEHEGGIRHTHSIDRLIVRAPGRT